MSGTHRHHPDYEFPGRVRVIAADPDFGEVDLTLTRAQTVVITAGIVATHLVVCAVAVRALRALTRR